MVFFDENWEQTEKNKAHYYRKIYFQERRGLYKIEDYYISDTLQMEGFFQDSYAKNAKGTIKWYHPNSTIKEEIFYENFGPLGRSKHFYENGQLKEVRNYLRPDQDVPYTIEELYSENGDTLVYRGNGNYITLSKKQEIKIEGKLKHGLKIGEWKAYRKNGDLYYKETYNEHGELLKGISYDLEQNEYPYKVVISKAIYEKGDSYYYKKISKNIKYPKNALSSGIEGTVYVLIVVDKNGGIHKAKVLKGIGSGCDEEALRVINKFDEWIPALERGQKIISEVIVPIRFIK
jgi:TonB family protein